MPSWIRAGLLTGLVSLGLSTGAHAASYDPDMKWRTITTEHFKIHFHQGEEALAEEFSFIVEDVYDEMTEEVGWTPRRRTEVVIVDRTDYANGYASTVPYNQIVLFATAPTGDSTLQLYEDWATGLFTHELTHILHMDANHGIVRAARGVVGRIASTNNLAPSWMIEGFATFQETRHTTGGRGRASWPDMIKRTSVLSDSFPPLGNMDGYTPIPPGGNLRYLYGQDFIQYVADHQGEDVWTRWVHIYGQHVPYILPSKKSFGKRLVPLYYDWRSHLTEKYTAQADRIKEEGQTIGRLVSGGEASCAAPAFSPDGDQLVWSCYDLKQGNAIWMSDGEGYAREVLLKDRGAGYFTWRSDSKAFVYAGVHLVNRFNTWSDIYLYTLGSSSPRSLTSAARARDPDFSPDGSRLMYVTNKVQNNQLETATVDQQRHRLTENEDHTQYDTPRFSPDGQAVALSVWQEGRRDLWLYSPEGEPLRRITADAAIDTSPVWSADGRWLYFTSDRSGVPNIYGIELATEHLYQITNVLTGATRASVHPSGQWMAYQEYAQHGWDVRILDLDQERYFDRGLLPKGPRYNQPFSQLVGPVDAPPTDAITTAWDDATLQELPARAPRTAFLPSLAGDFQNPPSETVQSFDDEDVSDVYGEEQDYPFTITPHRYQPLSGLIPRYLSPYIQSTPFEPGEHFDWAPIALQGSVSTSAADPLRHFAWGAWGTYRTDAEHFGGGASFTVNRFIPVYSMVGSSSAIPNVLIPQVDPDNPVDENGELLIDDQTGPRYWERRNALSATVSYPYKLRTSIFANYSLISRQPLIELPENTWFPGLPLRGTYGTLSGGWRYAWQQQTALAVSREDGRIFSFVGSVRHPYLGSSIVQDDGTTTTMSQLQLTSEVREYVVNPLIPNHVLAMRASGAVTFGANDFLGNYLVGGSAGDNAFNITPDEFRMLRGYRFFADNGDMLWLGNLEYRFPIWRIERGVGTLPAYARYLSGAAFIDSGNAFNAPGASGAATTAQEFARAAFGDPLVGVGGELSLSTVLGWGVGITGRAGFAVGLTEGGIKPSDGLESMYFQLGGSF